MTLLKAMQRAIVRTHYLHVWSSVRLLHEIEDGREMITNACIIYSIQAKQF
jgi:hypothetical protein